MSLAADTADAGPVEGEEEGANPGSCKEQATARRRRRQAASGSINADGSAGSKPKTLRMKVSCALAGNAGTAKAQEPSVVKPESKRGS